MDVRRRLSRSMTRLRAAQQRRSEEEFARRVAQHTELRAQPVTVMAGRSNFAQARVPHGMDLTAAWAWRFLVIAAAGVAIGYTIGKFSVIVLPVVVAVLIAALAVPVVDGMQRGGVPRRLAALLVVVGGLVFVGLLLTFVGQQVAQGANDLARQVVDGLEQIRLWLRDGPLHASDSQINGYITQVQDLITSGNQHVVTRITEVGTALGHIVAGFFIVLFATYFFLADGAAIWGWLVRIFPRAARGRADSSGRVAWVSLTAFVRATVLVALTDAIGVTLVALILKVPFAPAIGVLVFLGAFIPLIGATLSGSVAVLVALVAHGPLVALLMLGGVVLVQQIEAHVLQPFLLGRFVRVHPLGVILALGCGVIVAGIAGALVAVPLVAALNAVVLHLADTAGTAEPAGPAEPA
ncbi:MAG TPA: AI-2E family transporter [Nocardioidaceae bacterium]|jgi:predicted PurR-regulated permease PerM|nr:AI-2E family transporter [Nocardioidaceae bacterium]